MSKVHDIVKRELGLAVEEMTGTSLAIASSKIDINLLISEMITKQSNRSTSFEINRLKRVNSELSRKKEQAESKLKKEQKLRLQVTKERDQYIIENNYLHDQIYQLKQESSTSAVTSSISSTPAVTSSISSTPAVTSSILSNSSTPALTSSSILSNSSTQALTSSILSNSSTQALTSSILSNSSTQAINSSILSNSSTSALNVTRSNSSTSASDDMRMTTQISVPFDKSCSAPSQLDYSSNSSAASNQYFSASNQYFSEQVTFNLNVGNEIDYGYNESQSDENSTVPYYEGISTPESLVQSINYSALSLSLTSSCDQQESDEAQTVPIIQTGELPLFVDESTQLEWANRN